ncbi:MAG: hypothetical protein M1115_06900 [Actinobacteria bacterium]|nr:hypothetical protein [Actinomycetota bacterium]
MRRREITRHSPADRRHHRWEHTGRGTDEPALGRWVWSRGTPLATGTGSAYEHALSGFAQWDRVVVNDGALSDLAAKAADLVGALSRSTAA